MVRAGRETAPASGPPQPTSEVAGTADSHSRKSKPTIIVLWGRTFDYYAISASCGVRHTNQRWPSALYRALLTTLSPQHAVRVELHDRRKPYRVGNPPVSNLEVQDQLGIMRTLRNTKRHDSRHVRDMTHLTRVEEEDQECRCLIVCISYICICDTIHVCVC